MLTPLYAQTSISVNPWITICVVVVGAVGTLLLHIFLVVTASIARSQEPRLEMLRSAVEDLNEGIYFYMIINARMVIDRKKAIRSKNPTPEDRYQSNMDFIEKGGKHLTSASGKMLALSQNGLAEEIRLLTAWAADLSRRLVTSTTVEDCEKIQNDYSSGLRIRRESISDLLAKQLREEALLITAFKRYFGML